MTTDTAKMLQAVEVFVCRFVAFADEHQPAAVALWVAHTWTYETGQVTPRLAVQSAEKGSGKTRLLEVLELLCRAPERPTSITPSALFRIIDSAPATLLIDEVDAIFGPQVNGTTEELRAILNSGYRQGATVARVEGDRKRVVKRFKVYAPAALSGIGKLPDTVQDRSVVINLRKRAPGETIERFRIRTAAFEGGAIACDLEAWAPAVTDVLTGADPHLPDQLGDRAADSWEPLLAIAELAGGDWPDRARAAAVGLPASDADDEQSIGVRLLADLHAIWPADDTNLATTVVLDRLHALDEAPWADWFGHPFSARDLAKKLRPFGVTSRTVRFGLGSKEHAKGYRRVDLVDPWTRYLPPRKEGDIRDIGDNPTVATPQLSPLSPMSPPLEGGSTDPTDLDPEVF